MLLGCGGRWQSMGRGRCGVLGLPAEKVLGVRGVARRRASDVWPLRQRPSNARVPGGSPAKAVRCAISHGKGRPMRWSPAGPRRRDLGARQNRGEGARVRGPAAKRRRCAIQVQPKATDERFPVLFAHWEGFDENFPRIRTPSPGRRASRAVRRAVAYRGGALAAILPQPTAHRGHSPQLHRAPGAIRRAVGLPTRAFAGMRPSAPACRSASCAPDGRGPGRFAVLGLGPRPSRHPRRRPSAGPPRLPPRAPARCGR